MVHNYGSVLPGHRSPSLALPDLAPLIQHLGRGPRIYKRVHVARSLVGCLDFSAAECFDPGD
jgi:hypothetical protein